MSAPASVLSPAPGPLPTSGPPPASALTPSSALAELSHDLRTPLTSVRLLVQALRDGVVEEDQRSEYLSQIDREVAALTTLVDELHAISRGPTGRRGAGRDCLASRQLIEVAIRTMAIQAEAQGVRLERDLAPRLPWIRADSSQLHRALLNVIENAIRHTPAGGCVTVRARRVLAGVEIEVQDDGAGIPVEDRVRVFEAFYGADQEISDARSGLGLAIARGAVEEHGGRIWLAESESGTRIRISLPSTGCRTRRQGLPGSASSNDSLSIVPSPLKTAW
jgi:signal transduction histidine kinase